ncbi:hypothetical protein FCV25MIE_31664 [Fagus crenata]
MKLKVKILLVGCFGLLLCYGNFGIGLFADMLVIVIDLVRRCQYGLQLPWVEHCHLLSGHGTLYTVPNPPFCRSGLQLQQVKCCDLVFNFNKSIDVGPMVTNLVCWWLIWSAGG